LEWNDSQTLVVHIVKLENSAQIDGKFEFFFFFWHAFGCSRYYDDAE
jgi:hypothetical protein